MHYTIAPSPRRLVRAALLSVSKHCPGQQTDGRVLVSAQRYKEVPGLTWMGKWVSMLDLKAGFHNIPFETTSSYDSTFVTHRGKFRWLRMPMGLT